MSNMDKGRATAIGDLYRDCHSFHYAAFRQLMNGLTNAVWRAEEAERYRKRERPARRERRFNRETV